MKKIISLLSAFAIMSTLAVSVSAAGPTLTLSASATGYEKDDIVTVTCTYSGFEVTPYDSSTGTGAKLNSYQTFVNIPGGIGKSSDGEQFVKLGSSITGSLNTGTLTPNFITADDQFSAVYYGGEDPLNGSGVLFTAQIKLLKPITADLVFTFDTVEESNIGYDLYEEEEYADTILNPISGANLVGCTLKAPATEVAVTGVTLSQSELALDLNGNASATLTATVAPDNATDKTVTWTTSADDVATVVNGVVTAKKVGTATITATAGGKSATCTVTVTDSTPASPVGQQIADGAYYVGAKELAGLTDNTKFVIKYGAQSKNIGQTLGEILGGVSVGSLQGKLHFAIKPVSVDASALDFSQFVIDTVNE